MLAVNFFFGVGVITSYILRNSMITEMSDCKYRSYFINFNISSAPTSYILYFFIFSKNKPWIYVYSGNALILVLSITIFFFFFVNSPSFYINKEDEKSQQKLKESCDYISWVNCKEIRQLQICLNSTYGIEVSIITHENESDIIEVLDFKQKY
jgi:hypothetical protein